MTSLGNHGMCRALSTNTIHGLSTKNVSHVNVDKINDMSFSNNEINLQRLNIDNKYKIDLSNNNFTITKTTADGGQVEILKHDKNTNGNDKTNCI